MRKVVTLIAVAILSLVPFVGVSSVSAQQFVCDIGYTGPDSSNKCTSTVTYKCEVTNDNNVTIKNENDQTVASGNVSNTDNTNGGSGTSGTVTNSNGTTFDVVITNDAEKICSATSSVPATPVEPTPKPEPTPEQPAGGEGEVQGEVTVLPNTSNPQPFSLLAITGAFVVIATTATAILVLIRRRLGL